MSRYAVLTILSLLLLSPAVATPDSLGAVLLEAFTQGMFTDSSSVGPVEQVTEAEIGPTSEVEPSFSPDITPYFDMEPSYTPDVTPVFDLDPSYTPDFDIEPSSTPEMTPDFELEPSTTPEATPDFEIDPSYAPEVSSSPDVSPDFDLELLLPSPDFVEISPSPESMFDIMLDIGDDLMVNCGSFDVRNVGWITDDTPWYNEDSYVANDPFAETQFGTLQEGLLYSSYRYSDSNLTYSIPVNDTGIWKVGLRWAEIELTAMREGARVFSVDINGVEMHESVDVFRDSTFGSFSPLARTHIVDVEGDEIVINLGKKVGQPMLSALDISYLGPITM